MAVELKMFMMQSGYFHACMVFMLNNFQHAWTFTHENLIWKHPAHVPLLSFLVRKYRLSWFKFDLLLRSCIFACVMKVHRHDVDDGLIASSVPISAIVRHHHRAGHVIVLLWYLGYVFVRSLM